MQLGVLSAIQGLGYHTTLFGIPFFFSVWTILLAGGFSFLASSYIRKQMRAFPESSYLVASIGAGLTVAASVMMHEGSHAVVGWLCGLTTTHGGMSWWGAYVSFDHTINTLPPSYEIAIGLSGVTANAIIAGLATLVVWILRESEFENAVQFVAIINYRLAISNLLPISGLDGSKVAEGFLRPFVTPETIGTLLFISTLILVPYFFGFYGKKNPSKFELLLEKI